MRIDSATGTKAWLIGKFSGSFKGYLTGSADSASYAGFAETASYAFEASHSENASFAESASYSEIASSSFIAESASYSEFANKSRNAETASYMESKDFGKSLDEAVDDPDNCKIFNKLFRKSRLNVFGGIRVLTGSVEIDSGSLRIGRAQLDYESEDEGLRVSFVGSDPPGPFPPPPCPDCPPPCPPPPPPVPPCPFYPTGSPFPPGPYPYPFTCEYCPASGSCGLTPKPGKKVTYPSIDFFRDGRYKSYGNPDKD